MASHLLNYETFIEIHVHQLRASGVPEIYWENLFVKLKTEKILFETTQLYDAGMIFEMQIDPDAANDSVFGGWRVMCTSSRPIKLDDPQHIYLIDHAWTYQIEDMRAALDAVPGLVERMVNLMNLEPAGSSMEEQIEAILDKMWCFNQTYSFGNFDLGSEAAKPKWYIMDEFGSRIQHSDTPNFRVVPFFYTGAGIAYSIMWPIMEVENGDEATRDFVDGELDPAKRSARLIPWMPQDMTDISFTQVEPDVSYFQSYRQDETWPSADFECEGLPRDRNLRVYIDYKDLREQLTDGRFDIVFDPLDADILWYCSHFHDFKTFSESRPNCLINQFPCENVLTVKDLLAITARRAAVTAKTDQDPFKSNPKWLPVTYNLNTELSKFVSYFQNRQKRGLDNHWICKPWNLARGLDTHVTKNLNRIIRVNESGPKVACKYVENPVLFFRSDIGSFVKFDLRFIVLLTSVEPLQLYAYEVFFLRFSNKAFSLDSLDDYETHFTVMNYLEGSTDKLYQMHYDEFISEFQDQNPAFTWTEVVNDIFRALKELFTAAVSAPPPKGICPSPQSRAMYAVDLMLAWDKQPSGERVQPTILEVNFGPDCARACKYHPSFVNDIFSVLFMDDTEGKRVVPL
ncbi:unnamed protein product [Candidula unifasciata]|uniref:Tubulin--tyrosine ligase-like protein 12 SET-like domain-containing protein n=1 Tax=Candidula unifasciata TaxID=100452 RepID=A0A8S3YY52_9EUPU|nr:unnamed protein product [Candidula unifasciata]